VPDCFLSDCGQSVTDVAVEPRNIRKICWPEAVHSSAKSVGSCQEAFEI
jgi:hypothetical protein